MLHFHQKKEAQIAKRVKFFRVVKKWPIPWLDDMWELCVTYFRGDVNPSVKSNKSVLH